MKEYHLLIKCLEGLEDILEMIQQLKPLQISGTINKFDPT